MMKKIIYMAVAGLIILSASCKKSFLDENLKSAYGTDNTLIDELGFEAAVSGMQGRFRNDYSNVQGLLATFYVGTDIAYTGMPRAIQTPFDDYNQLTSQDDASKRLWVWAYQLISSANLIIKSADSGNPALTDQQRKSYSAEAKFYRAYAYNFLSSLYGPVPLIKEPSTAPKIDFVRPSMPEVLNFIIEDLQFAETNLPKITQVKKQGRISQSAAAQLLAEVYLRADKAGLAEQEANKVIAESAIQMVKTRYGINKDKPGDPFSDMFISGNMRRSQGNTEAIWVVEQQYNVAGGDAGFDQHRREWGPFYSQIGGVLVADSLGGRSIGRIRPTNWWTYELYEKNDMRNSPFNIRRNYYYNSPASDKFGQKVVVTGFDTVQNIYAHTTKWYYFIPEQDVILKDRIQMRLAETYLLLAEAQLKQGKFPEAAGSINVLRDRAHASQVDAADVTLDLILDERARELVAEELRRNTLARTGTLVDRVKRHNPKAAASIKSYNMFLPIPQSEIDVNKGAKLEQNLGYY